MKLSHLLIVLAPLWLCAACHSLDNPLSGLLNSGNDARIYDAQSGNYEWPESASPRPLRKSVPNARTSRTQAGPAPRGDGRYFDARKNQWVEAEPGQPRPRRAKSVAPPTVTAGAPAPPRPASASGIYNADTGKFEWSSTSPSRPAAAPAPKKRWLLF